MLLEIIFQDQDYIAINKPSGLLVHRSPIDRHETRFAIQTLRDQIGQPVYPVHRLDKPTSGVLLFALNKEALKAAQKQFMDASQEETTDKHQTSQKLTKEYLAIVRGYAPDNLTIQHTVKAREDKQNPDTRNNKEGITLVQSLAQCEINHMVEKYLVSRYSLVKLKPLTGRRHQLRYHLKHISHPIIGDAKYGKGTHNRFFQKQYNNQRLLLAATTLNFQQPFTKEIIQLNASPTPDFIAITDALGWSDTIKQQFSACA